MLCKCISICDLFCTRERLLSPNSGMRGARLECVTDWRKWCTASTTLNHSVMRITTADMVRFEHCAKLLLTGYALNCGALTCSSGVVCFGKSWTTVHTRLHASYCATFNFCSHFYYYDWKNNGFSRKYVDVCKSVILLWLFIQFCNWCCLQLLLLPLFYV